MTAERGNAILFAFRQERATMRLTERRGLNAFMTDGKAPAQPASPQPFAPSGLVVAGTGWLSWTKSGASSARGIA